MVVRILSKSFLMLFFLSLVVSCMDGNREAKPSSIGQPYKVVLMGDTDSILTDILQTDVPGLPQPEPMFHVLRVKKGKAESLYQTMRNRIWVDVNPHHKNFEVKMKQDVKACPQICIYVKAQTVAQLKNRLDGDKLRTILDQSELKHLAQVIKQNPEKQEVVRKMFGINMKIPFGMDASKNAPNFLWLSNNTNTGMQNLLFLKAKHERGVDEMLRKNIKGETDSMYMVIPKLQERGLWEMKGDAMGGPYVMKRKGNVVIIGFVYAPEMKKRNLMKQLEAVINTIK